ncbi:hypothetical protein [Variovorax sp. LjRoot178]|uniref:hypothetical protein n=1 Tax=Variovorax sp. LjRoot178 TaxID=3342277 RepID=UPI003ED0D062
MKVVSTGSFDDLQQALTAEFIRAIKAELEKVDTPDDLVEQLTGSIAFAVTSVLDDVAGFEADGRPVSPTLTFQTSDETLEGAGGNSWMHEYVYRLLPAAFERSS